MSPFPSLFAPRKPAVQETSATPASSPLAEPARSPMRTISPSDLPAFCPLPASATEDARLAFLFRSSLKLGRVHPLYLPILKYRNARPDRG